MCPISLLKYLCLSMFNTQIFSQNIANQYPIYKLGNSMDENDMCLLAKLMLMLVVVMLILMLLNLNTEYADIDAGLCIIIMSNYFFSFNPQVIYQKLRSTIKSKEVCIWLFSCKFKLFKLWNGHFQLIYIGLSSLIKSVWMKIISSS